MTRSRVVSNRLLGVVLMSAGLAVSGCNATSTTNSPDKERPTMSTTNRIRLEHVAVNVQDPVAMAKWYCQNLGMKVVREGPAPANARFLSDAGGNMMLEIYHNPPDAVPDYASMNPLSLHIAFMVDDVQTLRQKLVAAGATVHEDVYTTDSGDQIVMLRDPWGVPIQFLKRAKPMLSHD